MPTIATASRWAMLNIEFVHFTINGAEAGARRLGLP